MSCAAIDSTSTMLYLILLVTNVRPESAEVCLPFDTSVLHRRVAHHLVWTSGVPDLLVAFSFEVNADHGPLALLSSLPTVAPELIGLFEYCLLSRSVSVVVLPLCSIYL